MSTSLDFRPPEVAQISEPMNLDFAYDLLKEEFQLLEREVRLGLQIDNPMINQIGNFIWNSGGRGYVRYWYFSPVGSAITSVPRM
jgi:hypothetical protein